MNRSTAQFKPKDPNYQVKVRNSFARQATMQSLQVELQTVEPGIVQLSMPYQQTFTQQHGFIHAGIISTALDSACGYAAFSLMPAEAAVLSVEFKVNLLAPAQGERFIFIAEVLKPGRTISVVEGKAYAEQGQKSKLIASMNGTMMSIIDRPGVHQ